MNQHSTEGKPKRVYKKKVLTPEQISAKLACPGMRIEDALVIFPFGRNRLYELIHDGSIPCRKVGRIMILSTQGLKDLISPKEAAE
jgi:hypothetical protein